ncbi:MAG TPA: response regulator [Azospirillum sp.]|nr:response regulator [Azospirillum sp.]
MATVLIVDDSRLARDMVSSVVTSLHPDWTVLVASGGAEALALVEGRTPHAAILDYNMPGMDGLELAGHLRARFPALPMGFLTANVQESLKKKAEALGCGFIPKPITTDKIRAFLAGAGL